MNVKKRNVDFRVSRIIVIGKGDIIITSGIINIDVIVKSSIFSIILTAITIVITFFEFSFFFLFFVLRCFYVRS